MDSTGGAPDPNTQPLNNLLAALSGRERQILELLGLHLTSKEIGVQLRIHQRTVDNHCCNICRKFGVNSRFDAVRICTQSTPETLLQPE